MSTRPLHTIARTNSSVHITTPRNSEVLGLIGGGLVHEGLALTNDEVRALRKLYGYDEPRKRPRLSEEEEPSYEVREQIRKADKSQKVEDFHQAGADRNLIRHAQLDGLRLVAWLAKFVDKDEDPLAFLVSVMADSGMDVDIEDIEWVHGTADDPPDFDPR